MPHKALPHQTKCDVIHEVKTISDSISQDILAQIFDYQTSHYKNQVHKNDCICNK